MASAVLTWTPAGTTGTQKVYYKPSSSSTYTLFSTIAATATTETVTGLSNNLSYDFKVENNCGGTATFITMSQINITCPSFSVVTPTSNTLSFSFTSNASPSSITRYVVDLLDASNNVIDTVSFLYTASSTNTGTFLGLTPLTNYGLRITVFAGTLSQTCTVSYTATTMTLGFYITNIDYDNDSVCVGSGETGVSLYDNAGATDILGDLTPGNWNGSDYVGIGQTVLVSPIPTGDDITIAGYRGCTSTAQLGHDSWIQLQNASGAIIDINTASSDNEIANKAILTGYGITNGWHVYIRKTATVLPFRIDVDSNPSGGGTHLTELEGFIQVPLGTAVERDSTGITGTISGKYDVYYKGTKLNPFGTINNGNMIISPGGVTPDGVIISRPASGYPVFANIGGLSYFLTPDATKTKGERFQTFSMLDLNNPNNIGIVSVDQSTTRRYPIINSVTRTGSTVFITSTWSTTSSPTSGNYEFYLIVIKDRGLGTEQVTHVPLTVSWNPSYANVIRLPNRIPSTSATVTHSRTIPVPGTYTTLELRIVSLVNWPSATTVDEVLMHHSTLHTI